MLFLLSRSFVSRGDDSNRGVINEDGGLPRAVFEPAGSACSVCIEDGSWTRIGT